VGAFHRALAVAGGQGARLLELRAAMSLARLRVSQGRTGEARALLAPVYESFTEGAHCAHLKAAAALLDQLR